MYCKYCGQEKPESDFEIANVIKGVQYRRKKCRACKGKRQVERIHEIRKAILEYKKTLSCERCGFSDWRALDFHHLHSKEFNISEFKGVSLETVMKEIGKCIVLCANCHRIEHLSE